MKIISGGQTGSDRAGLDAAKELGIPTGGFVPKGRLAEDGPISKEKYPELAETFSSDYPTRTKLNILTAEATLILCQNLEDMDRGTLLTRELCKQLKKPYKVIYLSFYFDPLTKLSQYAFNAKHELALWCKQWNILNIAGPRESKSPGVYNAAKKFLLEVLE